MRPHSLWRRQPILPQARRGRSSSPCRKGKSPGEQPHIPSQPLGGVQLGCTPRVGGSEAGRSGHPAAAQMCLFDLGAGEGASSVTVGPSPRLLPAGASLQPCLQSRGPGSTSRKLMLPAGVGGSRAQRPCSGSCGAQGFSNRCPHSLEHLERNGSSGAGDGKPKGSRSQLLTMALIGTGSGPWPGGAARVSGVAGPLILGAGAMASCSLPGGGRGERMWT